MNSSRVRLTLVMLLVLYSAPALGHAQATGPPASVRVTSDSITLAVGASRQLEVAVLDANGRRVEAPVVYVSLARRSLEVSDSGILTAHRPGTHTIVVRVPAASGADAAPELRREIVVEVPAPDVATLELVVPAGRLAVGSAVRLESRVTDISGATRTDLVPTLATSDPRIASVDRFGILRLLSPGEVTIVAEAGGVHDAVKIAVLANNVSRVEINASAEQARTGDVLHFDAVARSADGATIEGIPVQWALRARTDQAGIGEPPSGRIDEDGRFVAERAGEYTIVAAIAGVAASRSVVVVARDVARELELVGHGPVRDRFTSDLWVWEAPDGGDYALTGTWGADGHAYLWDVTDPGNIQLIDTIKVDARTVNDVKVSADGRIAVISREGASNRRNGLLILDVSDPRSGMKVLARYDDELTGGVHNVFIYEDHIYALSAGRRYDIINIEDPTKPHRVGRFELDTPGHSIHDVWVQDGIAWSSNWDDGVVAVDVGGGGRGGSPRNPVMMGQYADARGWNHAAFPYYSESTGKLYVFAGDEAYLRGKDPGTQDGLDFMDGYVHIIDWGDGSAPREVARYEVPEGGSHNLWVEDDILYVAYYQGGLRAVDVSGELMGDLYRQGREIGYFKAFDPKGTIANVAMAWGPQPYKGLIYFSDFHSGLWAVRVAAPPEQ